MSIVSNSAIVSQVLPSVITGITNLGVIITSAFFGGLFAGVWTNHFESKRRINDKRTEKYFEHRNSIVQIEQELIPLRVNISRNLASISDAIVNTNESNIRFILRFDRFSLSTGLGHKLLSLDLINMYAQLYSAIEKFNSDIDYVSGMVSSVREDQKVEKIDPSLVNSYKIFLPHLKDECEEIGQKSLDLLALSKIAIGKEDKNIKTQYVKDGKEIKYAISKESLNQKYDDIKKEEDASSHKDEKQPKFVAPFLDLKKVLITPVNI
jgi:hypothetical protein